MVKRKKVFNFPYSGNINVNEFNDIYICPNGKDLISNNKYNKVGYKIYKADKCDCKDCPFKEQCTKSTYKQILRHRR